MCPWSRAVRRGCIPPRCSFVLRFLSAANNLGRFDALVYVYRPDTARSVEAHSAVPLTFSIVCRELEGGRVHLACPWSPVCGAVPTRISVPWHAPSGTRLQPFFV